MFLFLEPERNLNLFVIYLYLVYKINNISKGDILHIFTLKYSSASKPSTLGFLSLNFLFPCALLASSSSCSVSLVTSLIEEGAFSKMWHLCSFTTSVAFFSGILPQLAFGWEERKRLCKEEICLSFIYNRGKAVAVCSNILQPQPVAKLTNQSQAIDARHHISQLDSGFI